MIDPLNTERAIAFEMEQWIAPEAWMVGAATRLLDCWEPQVEWVRMPALHWRPSRIEMRVRQGTLPGSPARSGLRRRSGRKQSLELHDETVAVDLRPIGGWNIAHAAIAGLPRFFAADRAVRQVGGGRTAIALVPGDVSPYVREAYEVFGIPMLATSADVVGHIFDGGMADHEAIALAAGLLPPRIVTLLDERSSETPRKVFLARRGSRCISNMPDVENVLKQRGFATIYPEKLSVLDQLRLLWHADEVVGVHGAALSLLLPRVLQQPRRPLHLVEIFGPGYVVSLYRCLAAALNANWIGIRGRLTPEVVRDLEVRREHNWRYRVAQVLRGRVPARWLRQDPAWQRTHQATSFEIDLESLELALHAVRDPHRPLPERVLG